MHIRIEPGVRLFVGVEGAGLAQVVDLDHRGHGRSRSRPAAEGSST